MDETSMDETSYAVTAPDDRARRERFWHVVDRALSHAHWSLTDFVEVESGFVEDPAVRRRFETIRARIHASLTGSRSQIRAAFELYVAAEIPGTGTAGGPAPERAARE